MAATAVLRASTSISIGSGFSGPTNAYGDPNSTYSLWTSAVGGATAAAGWDGFGAQAAIGSQPQSIDSIDITVVAHVNNATRISSLTVQLLDGTTRIGSPIALTRSTTVGFSQTVTFTGPFTWAQLANLGVAIDAGKNSQNQSTTLSVDAFGMVVNYTPVPPPGVFVKVRNGANGAFSDKQVFVRNGVNGPFVAATSIKKRSGINGSFV